MRAYFSGEQGSKGPKMRGTGEQSQFWGTGNIENQDFVLGEHGKKAICFRGPRERYPPNPHPHHWEDLIHTNFPIVSP